MIQFLGRQWETNGRRLVKPAVVIVVLALAYQLGQRAVPSLAQLLALVLGGAVAFVVLTRRLEWGLLALIPVAFFVPWEAGTGTKVPLNAAIVLVPFLLGVWILRMLVIEQKIQLGSSPVNAPALAFVVATTISLVIGNLPWIAFAEPASLPAQLGAWGLYVFSIGLLLLVGNEIRDIRWLRIITWLFVAVGGLFVLSRLVPGTARMTAALSASSTGSMFWTWLVALAYGQFVWNRDLRLHWRLLIGLVAAIALYVGFFVNRGWSSGWAPAFLAVWIITWLRSWRAALVLTVVGAAGVLILHPSLLTDIVQMDQYSIESRMAAWEILAGIVRVNPILGLGPANYYHYTPLFPIWGWAVEFNSHNNYVDIIAQTGLVGFGVFAWLTAALAWVGWWLRKRVHDGFSQGYVNAALGGLAGMLAAGMLGDWFLPFVYNIGFPGFRASMLAWLFLGGLIALEQMVKRGEHPAGSEP